jgi:hypothetical protein
LQQGQPTSKSSDEDFAIGKIVSLSLCRSPV